MDYEKAYKAVLKTATQWIKDGCTDKEKICLECVFPELRESEDERLRKAALEGIEYLERKLGWDAIGDTDILDVKEYLEKQKEPKPAEWSEEDEKMRNLAIEWAETMSGQYSFVSMDSTDFRKIITWLKSLRPSWKPSEEQMKALQCAIAFMEIRKASDYDITPLKSLYEQLKKLM